VTLPFAGSTVPGRTTLRSALRRAKSHGSKGSIAMQFLSATMAAVLLIAATGAGQALEERKLVRLPQPMQEHMLGNMRDHLVTLNEIIGDVADGKYDAASKLAEQRLGMSSLGLHGAAHMAPFMPQPMQDIGTSMHRAASRLAIVLQDTSVSPSLDTMRDVNRALHEVTTTCTSCHAGYRIR
jgi:hypothetical protein